MDTRLKRSLPAAIVAAAGIVCAALVLWLARVPSPSPVRAPMVANSPPAVVEHCKHAAELLYDVHWAAQCFKLGDMNDCMLPDAHAARVNAILVTEEARCMAAEMQASTR
jgi:hypothetical protein